MQALFYIALFGSFFFVVSSITVGVSMSTMQEMVDRRAQVEKMFRDVDFAINEIIHRESPSLEAFLGAREGEADAQNVLYTAADVSWSRAQLQTDPWQSDIEIRRIVENEPLAPGVEADVSYYVLASPGLDRNMETDLDINDNAGWRDLRSKGAQGDDIIHTFSTRGALLGIWNQAEAVEQRIKETARNRYQQKVKEFNNASDGVLEELTTCATVPDPENLSDIDCSRFTAELIDECSRVYIAQTEETSGPAEDEEGFPEEEQVTTEFLPGPETSVNECWKYEKGFYDEDLSSPLYSEDFPTMAGTLEIFDSLESFESPADIVSATETQTSRVRDELGLEPQFENDPFTNIDNAVGTLVFVKGDHPHELILGRRDSQAILGWNFNRQVPITPR